MTDWPGDPPDFVANKRVTAGGAYPDTDPYALNKNIVDCLKALYDLLTGDSLFAVDAKLKMDAGLSVEFWLGDAAGAEKLVVRDSAGVEVAAIDSDGNITLSGTVDGVDLAAHVLNANAHHAVATAVDGQHTFAGQVISGVDAAAAQKGHIQLTGQFGGTAASPDVRGVRETSRPTPLRWVQWQTAISKKGWS